MKQIFSLKKCSQNNCFHLVLFIKLSYLSIFLSEQMIQQLTLLVYTRGQECMGCQSEGVEVSAKPKECRPGFMAVGVGS